MSASDKICATHLSLVAGQWVFLGGAVAASQGRALLARLSKILDREDASRTLGGEGKWWFPGSQSNVADVRSGGKLSMSIHVAKVCFGFLRQPRRLA